MNLEKKFSYFCSQVEEANFLGIHFEKVKCHAPNYNHLTFFAFLYPVLKYLCITFDLLLNILSKQLKYRCSILLWYLNFLCVLLVFRSPKEQMNQGKSWSKAMDQIISWNEANLDTRQRRESEWMKNVNQKKNCW